MGERLLWLPTVDCARVVVDYRYIGHSGRRRSTGLRVTTKGEKTFEPKSVAII